MSAGLSFGALPAFADLSPDQQAMVMQSLQARAAEQQQAGSPDQLLFNRAGLGGGDNGFQPQDAGPQTTGAVARDVTHSAPAVAMDEAAVQRMEQPMLPPSPDHNVPPVPQAGPRDQGGPVPPAIPAPTPGPTQPAPQANPAAPGVGAVPLSMPSPMGLGVNAASIPSANSPSSAVSPTAAAQATAAGGGGSTDIFGKFLTGLQNPQVSDLLLNLGIGLMSQRGIGNGLAAGLSSYQKASNASLTHQLQQYQLMQQIQAQQATRKYLAGKGLPADQVEAATLNPSILSAVQTQMNQQPSMQTLGGKNYWLKPGERPGPENYAGEADVPLEQQAKKADVLASVADAHKEDSWITVSDGKGGQYLVNKSNLKAPGGDKATPSPFGAGQPGADAQSGNDGSLEANKLTVIPPNDKSIVEGADKTIMDKISAGYDKAQGAIGTLNAISRQKQAIDNGIISGAGANWRQKAAELGAQFLGIDPSLPANSQEYQAAASQKAAELAKAVSQQGHTTNMDLNLGKTIAGGDLTKTEQALRQIIDAQEILARDTIDHHNGFVSSYSNRKGITPEAQDRLSTFVVQAPDVYRYGQGKPNAVADPGSILPSPTAIPSLSVGQSHQLQGMTIRRVR